MNKNTPVRKEGLQRLLEIAGTKKRKLIWSSIFSVISATMALMPFIVIYYISVELLSAKTIDKDYVWTLVLISVCAIVARFLFQYLSIVLSHIAAYDIIYELRKQLAIHLSKLPMGYFTQRSSGTLKKILNDDIEEIEMFIGHHIPDIVTAIAIPVLTLGFLLTKDWRLALISLIPLYLAYRAQKWASSDSENLTTKYHAALENMNNTILEYVRGMPVIKVFNLTVNSFNAFKNAVINYQDFCIKWSDAATPFYATFIVLINATLFFILPFSIWFYIRGDLNISVLILFLLLGVGYSAPLVRVSHYGELIALIKQGVDRFDAIMYYPPMPEPKRTARICSHDIEFKNVFFAYDKKQVLKNISFKVKERNVTALVGPSGAGKTTIAQLIPRFWDIGEGEIFIGNQNIKSFRFEYLMQQISFVFQDVFMFNDTIYENIRMGLEGVVRKDIIRAAKNAQAHDFITALPEGYETVFGGEGTHLSGGEQQRISIARAFLKNAPIIILDEATAFADPENERKIQKAFTELMRDKTVIVIAHRLSTIRNANQILVINEGQLAEQGHHEELIEKQGLYRKMWDAHINAQRWAFNIAEVEDEQKN